MLSSLVLCSILVNLFAGERLHELYQALKRAFDVVKAVVDSVEAGVDSIEASVVTTEHAGIDEGVHGGLVESLLHAGELVRGCMIGSSFWAADPRSLRGTGLYLQSDAAEL